MTVCLNMIVRNEAHVIRRCLDSVMPLIDSWVIVDTGSTDGTQQIIREHLASIPGELFERPWVNFAHNRTEALRLAGGRGEYVLVIDADEVLELDAGFAMPLLTADSYNVEVRYNGCTYFRKQLVKSSLSWRYVGVLHEYVYSEEASTEAVLGGVRTVPRHDGARARDPQTYRRDALLLEQVLLEEPSNSRYVFYLAQSYRDAGDDDLAIRNYKRRVEMGGWPAEVWYSLYQIAVLRERRGDPWPEVMQDYLAAHHAAPDRAGPLYRIGMHYQALQQYALSYLFFSQAIRIPLPEGNRLFVERAIYDYLLPVEHAVSCYYTGDHESAIEIGNALLGSNVLPSSAIAQVLRNRRYSLDALFTKSCGTPLTPLHLEVVVPFQSCGAELEACIESLRGQSIPFHATLIADGATSTPQVADPRFTIVHHETGRGWDACVAAAAASLPRETIVVPLTPQQALADSGTLARIRRAFEDAGCALVYGNSGGAMPASGPRAFETYGAALAGQSPLVFRASLATDGIAGVWRAAGFQRTRFLDEPLVNETTNALPMISCLMITRDRLALAKRSLRCFAEQTYPNRELVIVTDGEPEYREALLRHARELGIERCRLVLAEIGTPLGRLRNMSIDAAAGELICQWDDDDANHPDRLAIQARALMQQRARVSFFTDHLHYIADQRRLYWIDWTLGGRIADQRQFFPGSLMMVRDTRFRYPESGPYARRGEDSVLLDQLLRNLPVARISGLGHLYLYHYHGANTFDRDHHERMSRCAAPGAFVKEREESIRAAVAHYALDEPVDVAGPDGTAFVIGASPRKSMADDVIAAYGPILHGTGFHDHASGFFRALHRLHPIAAMNVEREAPSTNVPHDVIEMLENGRRVGDRLPGVAIGVGPIEALPHIAGRKRIGFVVWEPSRLLPAQARLIGGLDEVWTATEWSRRLLIANGIREELVRVVPEGVDVERFTPAETREPRPFRFLCVARWQVRKGVDDLIAAYCREFAPDEPVELVLRSVLTAREKPVEARIAELPGPHPPIVGIDGMFTPQAMAELYRSADAFVLPTKAEAWGLPVFEAMASGLPVIVTNCSAPAELLDDSIAYLIRVKAMVPAYDPVWYPDRHAYGEWAQPDVEHLQSLMRHVYEHRDEARATGVRARAAVCERLTWEHAAQIASAFLGQA